MEQVFKIIKQYYSLDGVRAVGFDGSRSAEGSDALSDYDFCVITDKEPDIEKRKKIVLPYSSVYDIGQDFFGPCDEFMIDEGKIVVDVAFFNFVWLEENVRNVWQRYEASNGYTTAFLYTLKHAKILYDPSNWFEKIKLSINTPYPEKLRQNIISRNFLLMKDKSFASYIEQIKKAVKRGDYISINHRTSAFFASYFDALFAINMLLHPGEKRLISYALSHCKILPSNFSENIYSALTLRDENLPVLLSEMVEKLRSCI